MVTVVQAERRRSSNPSNDGERRRSRSVPISAEAALTNIAARTTRHADRIDRAASESPSRGVGSPSRGTSGVVRGTHDVDIPRGSFARVCSSSRCTKASRRSTSCFSSSRRRTCFAETAEDPLEDDVLLVTGAASIRRRIVLSHNGVLTGGPTTRARSVRRSDAQERDAHPGVDHDALVEDMIKDLDNTTVRAGPLDGHSLHLRVAPGRGTNADAPMMHSRCLDLRTISVRTCGRNGELPCPR